MTTRLLDAKIIFNKKSISLLNTDMEIYVEWDAKLKENFTSVDLSLNIISVHGNFNIYDNVDSYKTKTNIEFRTDKEWKIELSQEFYITFKEIQPIIGIINLDEKAIKLLL